MTEIRSFRRVFDLERRIYSIDQLRLNPGGVPVRGVVYFIALALASLALARLPLLGVLLGCVPWYLRGIALPLAASMLLSMVRIEGRTFHLAAQGLVRYAVGPRRLAGVGRCQAPGSLWQPRPIVFLPDGSDGRLRRLRYTGPGAVLVTIEHERGGRALERDGRGLARRGARAALTMRERGRAQRLDPGEVVDLVAGARLLVKGASRQARARR